MQLGSSWLHVWVVLTFAQPSAMLLWPLVQVHSRQCLYVAPSPPACHLSPPRSVILLPPCVFWSCGEGVMLCLPCRISSTVSLVLAWEVAAVLVFVWPWVGQGEAAVVSCGSGDKEQVIVQSPVGTGSALFTFPRGREPRPSPEPGRVPHCCPWPNLAWPGREDRNHK